MKKNIIIKTFFAAGAFALLTAGCSKIENTAGQSTSPSFGKPAETNSIGVALQKSGLMFDRRGTGDVPTPKDSAVLVLSLAVRMAGSYNVTLLKVADSSAVPVTCVWDIGTNYSTLTIKPNAALEFSKQYWIHVAAASIVDAFGNKLDLDGDGVGGEAVDDDFEFYFVTYDNTGAVSTPTDVARLVVDRRGPSIPGSLFCWIGGSQASVNGQYVDAAYYFRIVDQSLLADRSTYDAIASYLGTINDSKVWICDDITKRKIPAVVTFANDPDTAYHIMGSTVCIQPTEALAPAAVYHVLVKQNAIADAAGNKMGQNDGEGQDTVSFSITTGDSLSNHTLVRSDVTPPSYVFVNSSMKMTFNELVDESTLNGQSIWYANAGIDRAFVIAVSTEYTNLGKPRTIVRLTPSVGYTSGTLYVNMSKIKDLAGNYGSGIDSGDTF